ncbi:Neutrophil gelatinase-associated lipocalin [Heterocephalus glaber]|uniref:Neutrophil gelatinase-associated lipocalin n=1 Tax=Heterocephalus glaber TaxID=10181 RepID=G5AZX6_HETGA|nr:Neutrophil gelatinase-associated lipocalin [Heterocephalus glaber]
MALCLLCLSLTLLGILQTQAQDPPLAVPLNIPMYKVPVQSDFQDDQFQGKWYTIAVADNAIRFENLTHVHMYSTIFELKDDHSYNVTSRMFSEEQCELWIRTFVPTVLPGQFTLENITRFNQIQNYTVRVTATDYDQFATMFLKTTYKSRVYIEIILLGRTKELSLELKEGFLNFSKSLGLTEEDIIFTDPIGNVQLGRGGQDVGSVQVWCYTL